MISQRLASADIALPAATTYSNRMKYADKNSGQQRTPLRVVVSLDVEEEGLFSGRYASTDCTVRNVALLRRLAPLTQELGFPLTLFCSYAVFANAGARTHLAWMRDHCDADIAAHLHHWSTPPLTAQPATTGAPQRTYLMPKDLLRARLQTLLAAGRDFQSAPVTSFRMGRWDLKAPLLPLLAEEGVSLDSSICPLRCFANGADHFLAPADPYWPTDTPNLLEAPLTQVPLWPFLARTWYKLSPKGWTDSFHYWGAASPNPVWHSGPVMRAAACLHRLRHGKVLNLFWHSSEMLPGASPHIPDQAAADALLRKIYTFLAWLRARYAPQGITAAGLRAIAPDCGFTSRPKGSGDW